MTIPHLMNCSHSGEGWCLDCVAELEAERAELRKILVESSRELKTSLGQLSMGAGYFNSAYRKILGINAAIDVILKP